MKIWENVFYSGSIVAFLVYGKISDGCTWVPLSSKFIIYDFHLQITRLRWLV